ncbi:MAG: RNA polymerase sigma factor [Alphaproteobacteria bacterium]|jgi:RNA polymerase sigma factor (sigma-70 family)|nr:RNA polymerase sigma factor [Alphaproteobacteria bacterium]
MPDEHSNSGLQGVLLDNRERVLRFLVARGAGEDAEDLYHELWLRMGRRPAGPIAAPLSYIFSAANALMIDRYRSVSQARRRERDWVETTSDASSGVSDQPSVDRVIMGRQQARLVDEALAGLPPRAVAIFRRSRIDEIPQAQIAREFAISVSTVESDLRKAFRLLSEFKGRFDEE